MRQIVIALTVILSAHAALAQAPLPLPPGAVPYSCYPNQPSYTPVVPSIGNPLVPWIMTPYSFNFNSPSQFNPFYNPLQLPWNPTPVMKTEKLAKTEEDKRKEAEWQERMIERRQALEERRRSRRETVDPVKASPDQRANGMLQIAQRFLDDGEIELGRKWLDNLVSKYPLSDAASKAKLLLAEL